MLKSCVVLDGAVINVGEWDYNIQPVQVGEQEVIITPETVDSEGNVIPAVTEMQPIYEDQATNPFPEGAIIEEREVIQNADGGLVALESGQSILDAYKTSKIESLYTLCNEAVLGIFTSSALGILHNYIFDYEAQMNLAGTKQAFDSALVTSVEWNTRDAGVLAHDATQFNQLWLDGFLHKISTINKYRALKGQVESAVDKDGVDSIVW